MKKKHIFHKVKLNCSYEEIKRIDKSLRRLGIGPINYNPRPKRKTK